MKAFVVVFFLLSALLTAPGAGAQEKHKPIAATVGDINLYWQKNRGASFPLDTIGLAEVEKKLCDTSLADSTTITSAAAFFARCGKTLYRLENPQSIALALFIKSGFTVILFSQLAGDVAISTAVTKPQRAPLATPGDLEQTTPADLFGLQNNSVLDSSGAINYRKMRICSDFLWSTIDSCALFNPTGTRRDFLVAFDFKDRGSCEFDGHENVVMNSKIMRGIQGLSMQNHWLSYQTDGQVSRLFLNVYLCADRTSSPAAIRKQVEAKMDALKLDLSYKFPRLIPIPIK